MAETLPITRWRISDGKRTEQEQLIRELGIHEVLSQVLTNRDILDVESARRYLRPSLRDLHSPFLMRDMKAGVRRLIQALHRGEKVMIYGDYDADGITSVAVLYKFLRSIHEEVDYAIPDRIEDGYGLNLKAVEQMSGLGIGLIITVDCGISDHEPIARARAMGMDTIILDHHEVPPVLPPAVAAVNPNRPDCGFPFKSLAAVGIVFNFLIALRGELRREGFWTNRPYPNLRDYLDLVALGTIGDIAPLIDENRIFARIGLDLITEGKRLGLVALKEVAALDHQVIDSAKASYGLIPRINAAGRIASSEDAIRLLLTNDADEARQAAARLDGFNRRRQTMERSILHDLVAEIERRPDTPLRASFVFSSPRWHPGVIGIVAARLVDRYGRPVILISLKDGVGKGSGRSTPGFNIYEGLNRCAPALLSYGGHRFAAGISIRETDVESFSRQFEDIVSEVSSGRAFISETLIDAECALQDINRDLLSQIGLLAPFGSMNPEPVFCIRGVKIQEPAIVGNNHLRMRVTSNGASCNSIWFSKGHLLPDITGSTLDIAFTPQFNPWNGASTIQLKMKDVARTTSNRTPL